MATWEKFSLLMWKNYILQKRHIVQTVLEVLLPVAFTALLVGIRAAVSADEVNEIRTYVPFPIESTEGTRVNGSQYILYAPANQLTNTLMKNLVTTYLTNPNVLINYTQIGYTSEEELEEAYTTASFETDWQDYDPISEWINDNIVLACVVFENSFDGNEWPNDIKYKLRFPAPQHSGKNEAFRPRWRTDLLYPLFQAPAPRLDEEPEGGYPNYLKEGYLYMQHAIDASITRMINGPEATDDYSFYVQRFPYPPFKDDRFLVALQGWLPLILIFSFIYPIINITKSVVHEKERRLKESMKMMGLPNWLHWTAWFLKSFIVLTISVAIMTVLVKVKWYGDDLAVLVHSDGSLIFIFFLTFVYSTIGLAFLISTFFSKANAAATAGGVVFFLLYMPYSFITTRYEMLSHASKVLLCLMSPTGMSLGCQVISMFEGIGSGIQWNTITEGLNEDDNFSIFDVLIMLIFDGTLYIALTIYIEAVFPGDYGIPLPWYFPFTKWYWLGTPRNEDAAFMRNDLEVNAKYFEAEPKNLNARVQIKGLTKVFGEKVAVNNLSINMFEDQITSLLGHNGAGKTTTMSMLTGLFPPTSGTAYLNGFDIREDMKSVRKSLGLCPQHDVLFDELTCEEHIRFFCRLKGYDKNLVDEEIDYMLKAMNLEHKRHAQSHTLSGGMKRKLSVGVALAGKSSVVLLDEPTSGMDPGARRGTWDLLLGEKKGRTIILSTHFMEEADLLGDRIAIMAEGQVQCCGSSLFLKKRYGGGYHLVIVKEPNCKVDEITQLLRNKIESIEVDQNVGAELSYSLPDEMSHLFPPIFEQLESRKKELGISSYGASITTMEEVFMKVGKEAEEKKAEEDPSVKLNMANGDATEKLNLKNDYVRNSGLALLYQQLWAMMVKKSLYSIRNRLLMIFQIVIPIFFLVITLIILKTLPDVSDPPTLDATLTEYGSDKVTVMDNRTNAGAEISSAYYDFASMTSTVVSDVDFTKYITDKIEEDERDATNNYLVGLKINETLEQKTPLHAMFNNQPFHAPPISLNFISNAVLRSMSPNHRISTVNAPMPFTLQDEVREVGGPQSEAFTIGFNIAFGLSFLSSSFVVFLIKERESKAKHLQFVSGVKFPIFWLANFMFDIVNFIIPCLALMVVIAAFQVDQFKNAEMYFYLFLLFLAYGWSVIPFMYLFSFVFSIPSSGYTRMVMFNVITGMATIIAYTVLSIPDLGTENVADALNWVFMLFPNYNVGIGVSNLATNYDLNQACPLLKFAFPDYCAAQPDDRCCTDYPASYLGYTGAGIGTNLLFLFLTGIIFAVIITIIESKVLQKWGVMKLFEKNNQVSPSEDLLDSDVQEENHRIRSTYNEKLFETDNIVFKNLTKFYGSFQAVDNLCVGIKKGECFGLLGINGAGKTTTFKMLTGDIPVSSGDAFIHFTSVKTDIKKVQENLGYCPQFDALIEELTGRETIRLFARLRGVPEERIDNLVDSLAENLLLTPHIDKRCGSYSGGNKRKLSTALALIGGPPIVFLDEPTTGMDPVARRHLWNTITQIRENGASIILTSHSMEECEALCSRLAIMVNGKFRCLGSPQHLKSKFGEGYTLVAQLQRIAEGKITRRSIELARRRSSVLKTKEDNSQMQDWEKELQPLRGYIESSFPGCTLKDIHPGYLQYHITDPNISWGQMFAKMEQAKSSFNIEGYSVGQTSLEQVFLNFTKSQVTSEDD